MTMIPCFLCFLCLLGACLPNEDCLPTQHERPKNLCRLRELQQQHTATAAQQLRKPRLADASRGGGTGPSQKNCELLPFGAHEAPKQAHEFLASTNQWVFTL